MLAGITIYAIHIEPKYDQQHLYCALAKEMIKKLPKNQVALQDHIQEQVLLKEFITKRQEILISMIV